MNDNDNERTYIAYKLPTVGTLRPYLNPQTGEYFTLADCLAALPNDDKCYVVARCYDRSRFELVGIAINGDMLRPGMIPA